MNKDPMSYSDKKTVVELELMQPILNFQNQFESFGTLQILDNLAISLTEEFEMFKLQRPTTDSTVNEAEFIQAISAKVLSSKKKLIKDMRVFHNTVYKIFSFQLRSEDEEQKFQSVQQIFDWLRNFKIPINDSEIDVQLKSYFDDLSNLNNSMNSIKVMADDMGTANKLLNEELHAKTLELDVQRDRLNQKTTRNDKLASLVDRYKLDVSSLISQVERELEKTKSYEVNTNSKYMIEMLTQKVRNYATQFNVEDYSGLVFGSPIKSPKKFDVIYPELEDKGIWFDIDRSQQRYESLQDSYQGVIKDKDLYMKKMEEDILKAKREKFELEDQNFNFLREKERKINDLVAQIDDLNLKYKRTMDDTMHTQEDMRLQIERSLTSFREEKLRVEDLTAEKRNLEQKNRDLTEDSNKLNDRKQELEKTVQSQKDTIYESKRSLETQKKEFELLKYEFETTKVRMSTEAESRKIELDREIVLLKQTVEHGRDTLKERDNELSRYLEKVKDYEREIVLKDSDHVTLKSQIADAKKDLLTSHKHMDIQNEIEQKLRDDYNKNINIDYEMKREMDKMLDDINKLSQTLTDRDSRIAYLEKELSYNWNRNQRLSKTVDKIKYDPADDTRRSKRSSYLPYHYQSTKMIASKSPGRVISNNEYSPNKNIPNSIYYSNMPNYYSKYVPPADKK